MKSIHIITLQIMILFMGCSSGNYGVEKKSDRDARLVQSFAQNLTLKQIESFVSQVDQLQIKSNQYCKTSETSTSLTDLRQQWAEAMETYHFIEVLLYSPHTTFEDSSPYRFIYTHLPPQNAEKEIRKQIKRAFKQQENYQMLRPLSHSTGLNSLENLFFNILEADKKLTSDSGECIFLLYTTRTLFKRAVNLQSDWMDFELDYINSPDGQTSLKKIINSFIDHVIEFTDRQLKDLRLAAPLGLKQKEYPCESPDSCSDEYLEHPFYFHKKMALEAPLKILVQLFEEQNSSDLKSSSFSFADYLNEDNSSTVKTSSSQLRKVLNIVQELPGGDAYTELFETKEIKGSKINNVLIELKKFTDWLKIDFVLEMETKLPGAVQGDAD